MAHIVVNAMSLRKGGGMQVIAGLLASFSPRHRYTVLWTDPKSREIFEEVVGPRGNVDYARPIQTDANFAIFGWCMTRQAPWLRSNDADIVIGVNHHFPSGGVPQIIYHLNVLRFDRPSGSIASVGELADRLRDWRAQAALKHADANVFESNLLLEKARATGTRIRAPQVVYIGLDDRNGRFEGSRPRATIDDHPNPHLFAITSPAPHKDNATLARTLARLVELRPGIDWRMHVAGGERLEDFPALHTAAIDTGVAERIECLGFLAHDELEAVARRSLCLVTTSLVESFCMVALEAMSWDCPAVVADISAMPESVGDAALLAKPSDPDDFATKVLGLIEDRKLRHSFIERGRERAHQLTWSNAARAFEERMEYVLGTDGVGGR